MKRLKFFTLLTLSIFVIPSCGGDESNETEEQEKATQEEKVDVSDMSSLNMKEHGLDITIMLPSVSSSTGASIEPNITHEMDGFRWEVSLGEKFVLIIEDYAKEENLIAEEKKRIEGYDFFNIEYLVEEDQMIMYKRELPDGAGGDASYHVYGVKKLNGSNIVFRSVDDGFLKPIVEDMVRTIKSAESNEKPA